MKAYNSILRLIRVNGGVRSKPITCPDCRELQGDRTQLQGDRIQLQGDRIQHPGTLQGPMPLSPGRMPLVTKDIQVGYLYGMRLMVLVIQVLNKIYSYIATWWDRWHSAQVGDRDRQAGPRHPFGAWSTVIAVVDPAKIVTIFRDYLKSNISWYASLGGEATNRGDGILYNTLWKFLSPHLIY